MQVTSSSCKAATSHADWKMGHKDWGVEFVELLSLHKSHFWDFPGSPVAQAHTPVGGPAQLPGQGNKIPPAMIRCLHAKTKDL